MTVWPAGGAVKIEHCLPFRASTIAAETATQKVAARPMEGLFSASRQQTMEPPCAIVPYPEGILTGSTRVPRDERAHLHRNQHSEFLPRNAAGARPAITPRLDASMVGNARI